jgi:O-antigen/teichoic acid export membrane protein
MTDASPRGPHADSVDPAGETTAANVVRGGLWTLASRVVPQLQLIAISIAAARFLGPDEMGRQSFIAFVALSVVLVATAGLPAALSRFVAELQGARLGGVGRSIFWWTWRIEAAAATAGTAGIGIAALLGASPRAAWALAALGCGLAIMQTIPSALLVGVQRWRDATVAGLVTGAVSVPLTIAVLALGGGIPGFFAVETATIAVNTAWMWSLGRRALMRLPASEPIPKRYRDDYLRFAGATTLFTAVDFVVWRRSEFVFLASYSNDAQIALYSIAFASATALTKMPEAVAKVTTPAMATLLGAGEHGRVRSGYWRALRLLIFITPVIAAGAAALGPELLQLVYGDQYQGVRSVFLILVAPLPILPLLTTTDAVLFALGRLRFLIIVGLSATVVNIGLDLLLIPALDAVGAALANVGAQLAAGIPGLVYMTRLLGPPELPLGATLRSMAMAAVTGGCAFGVVEAVGGAAGVAAGLIVGGLAFAAAGMVLRPLADDDATWLTTLGSGRLTRTAAALAKSVSR